MLLAGLEGKSYGLVAKTVNCNADDSSRDASLVFFTGCQITCYRASESHRESESLGASHGDVCSPGCRFLQDCKGKQVAICGNHRSGLVHLFAECRIVSYLAIAGWVLNQRSEAHRVNLPLFPVAEDYLYSKTFCPGSDH